MENIYEFFFILLRAAFRPIHPSIHPTACFFVCFFRFVLLVCLFACLSTWCVCASLVITRGKYGVDRFILARVWPGY